MNVALVGATGNAGSRILTELVDRGHKVTAIARNPNQVAQLQGVTATKGDANDQVGLADLLKGHDAVISSLMFIVSDPGKLIGAVQASGVKRYLVVGGAGSLEVAPGLKVMDTPDFPAEYKGEAIAGGVFLDALQGTDGLDWTYLSPSAMFVPGERTGNFRLGTDQLLVSEAGSSISFEDYAIALVDELETPTHVRKRFTVGY